MPGGGRQRRQRWKVRTWRSVKPPPSLRSAPASALSPRAVLLFDIDGVIRDVSASYRRAIVETVHHYCGWRPEPGVIDALKSEEIGRAHV